MSILSVSVVSFIENNTGKEGGQPLFSRQNHGLFSVSFSSGVIFCDCSSNGFDFFELVSRVCKFVTLHLSLSG